MSEKLVRLQHSDGIVNGRIGPRLCENLQPSGRGLAFSDNMAGTMMACPDEVETQERRFLAALVQVSDYVRYGAGLVLTDVDGRAVLHFVETPE